MSRRKRNKNGTASDFKKNRIEEVKDLYSDQISLSNRDRPKSYDSSLYETQAEVLSALENADQSVDDVVKASKKLYFEDKRVFLG